MNLCFKYGLVGITSDVSLCRAEVTKGAFVLGLHAFLFDNRFHQTENGLLGLKYTNCHFE